MGKAAASSQVDDEGVENSHRQSEVGSSSETLAPVVDTYTAPLPSLVGDGLDSGSRVEAVQNPPLIIPQSSNGDLAILSTCSVVICCVYTTKLRSCL